MRQCRQITLLLTMGFSRIGNAKGLVRGISLFAMEGLRFGFERLCVEGRRFGSAEAFGTWFCMGLDLLLVFDVGVVRRPRRLVD